MTRTREIYEKAIETLKEKDVRDMCMRFAKMELMLGEVDRARGIYTHCSQFCDPRKEKDFWDIYRQFEVQHGNEDTFREMLRLKRSVEAQYTQTHFNAENIMAEMTGGDALDPMQIAEAELQAEDRKRKALSGELNVEDMKRRRLMEDLGTAVKERNAKFEAAESFSGARSGWLFKMGDRGLGYYEDISLKDARDREASERASSSLGPAAGAGAASAPTMVANAEEIDLDMDDIEETTVPADVFGGAGSVLTKEKEKLDEEAKNAPQEPDDDEDDAAAEPKKMGALDRFRKKKGGGKGKGGRGKDQ